MTDDLEREAVPLHAWDAESEERVLHTRVFDITERRCRERETGKRATFVRIESPDWVNVVALTPERRIVLIEQFRLGVDAVTLEVPGGMVDPGETAEEAARRELVEETGFVAETWTEIGEVQPNPALQGNRTTTYLAEGARRETTPSFDGNERCRLVTAPFQRALELVDARRIQHALVVNALLFAERHLRSR